MNFILELLKSASGAALLAGFFGIWQWRLNRKAHKEDKAADQKVADCAARGQEIADLRNLVNGLIIAERESFYDRIKHLGKAYIAREYITVEELEDIDLMHGVYHDKDKLGGNGFLDALMKTVHGLEVRAS